MQRYQVKQVKLSLSDGNGVTVKQNEAVTEQLHARSRTGCLGYLSLPGFAPEWVGGK